MIRRAIAAGLLALCLGCLGGPPALAGPEIYYLVGLGLGQLGDDVDAYAATTAQGLDSVVEGPWAAETKTRVGFDAGVGFAYPVYDPVSVAIEARFASRGEKWYLRQPDLSWELKQSLALNYLELPLLVRLQARAGADVRPSVFLGPVLAVRLASKTTTAVTSVPGSLPDTLVAKQALELLGYLSSVEVDDFAKDSYVGGTIGVGVQIRTTQTTSLLLQARYLKAFGNVLEAAAGYDFRPQDWSFLLGMTFQL